MYDLVTYLEIKEGISYHQGHASMHRVNTVMDYLASLQRTKINGKVEGLTACSQLHDAKVDCNNELSG